MSPKGPRRPSLQPPLFRSSDSWALDDGRDVLPAPRQPGRLRPRRPLPPLGKGSLSENGKDTCCGRFKQKPSFLVSLEEQLTGHSHQAALHHLLEQQRPEAPVSLGFAPAPQGQARRGSGDPAARERDGWGRSAIWRPSRLSAPLGTRGPRTCSTPAAP